MRSVMNLVSRVGSKPASKWTVIGYQHPRGCDASRMGGLEGGGGVEALIDAMTWVEVDCGGFMEVLIGMP